MLGTGCLRESLGLVEGLTWRIPVTVMCCAVKSIRVSANHLLSSCSIASHEGGLLNFLGNILNSHVFADSIFEC